MTDSENRINKIIADNLVRLLREKNRTQLELAEYLGVTQATVSNWCNGIKMPRMDKIDTICEYFDVKRSNLMSAPSSFRSDDTDALFIKKYGQNIYDAAMKYGSLDEVDRIRISERMDMMLEDDKYKDGASLESKVI